MSNIRKEIGRWVKISLFTFPLSAFVACENEDFVPQDDIGDVVEVTAAIGDAPHTRVSQPEDNKYVFDDKDKIHIVGWHGYEDWSEDLKWHFKAPDGGSSHYNWWNDAVSTYDATSGKWRTEPYMRWQNGGYDLKHYFIAWWPENVVESTADLEKVNINLTGNYKTDDILLAREYDKKKPDDNKLNLKFEHLMSRFDVRLQFREYYTDVKDITVSANLYTEATCNFFRRTTQNTGTTKTVNLTESETMQGFYWSGACITVPQEINLHDIGLTINFTAGGEQKQVKLQETRNMTFESGKRIIFNLTIGNDAVVLGNVTQTDWQDVDCDNLKAEECKHEILIEKGICILCKTLVSVDLGLSVNWATVNIGASKLEQVGNFFAWGETEPKETYSQENYKFGDKYNATDGKTVLDDSDDAAMRIWGNGWRMPTAEEFAELLDESKCTWTWITVNGRTGYVITSKVPGYESNSIFLPFEFYKTSGNETVQHSGYWSKSLSTSSLTGATIAAKCISFHLSYKGDDERSRFLGMLIRPVREKNNLEN